MNRRRCRREFVTQERLARAVRVADTIAARQPHLSAFDCADRAVRDIFGPWLLDASDSVPVEDCAFFYRLVDDVEQQLGVHRRRPQALGPLVASATMEAPQPAGGSLIV